MTKICKKHGLKGILYCTNHAVDYLCPSCFDDEHKDCIMWTMNKKNVHLPEPLYYNDNDLVEHDNGNWCWDNGKLEKR